MEDVKGRALSFPFYIDSHKIIGESYTNTNLGRDTVHRDKDRGNTKMGNSEVSL